MYAKVVLSAATAASLLVDCGGRAATESNRTVVSAGGARAFGSDAMGAACAVESESGGSHRVTFRASNSGPAAQWLYLDCTLRYDLYTCADDYHRTLPINAMCVTDCSDTGSCHGCTVCKRESIPVLQGETYEFAWDGQVYAFGTTIQECYCATVEPAAAGLYVLGLQVWADDPLADTSGVVPEPNRYLRVPFTLAGPETTVALDLRP